MAEPVPISHPDSLRRINTFNVDAARSNMKLYEFMPTPGLSPYISKYLIIESSGDHDNHILPETSVVMSFRLRGVVTSSKNNLIDTLPRLLVSGIRKSDRLMNYKKGTANLLVIFKPAGAFSFIREPLNELFDETAALDSLEGYGDTTQKVEEMLSQSTDHKSAISSIEQFLMSKLIIAKADAMVSKAILEINSSHGNVRIKKLAEHLFVSLDPFEKRFRRLTGVSPKQFAHIVRMKAVISDIRANKYRDLGEAVFHAGYFDTPHFYKDFRSFTSQTPTQFFQSPERW